MKTHPITRRKFLRSTAVISAASVFPFVSARNVLGANNRLNIAGIGVGGKGAVDIGYCSRENVVALCDVDDRQAAGTYKKFPRARRFRDFRVMLEKAGSQIDAVTVSTPDHTHIFSALMAVRMNKHVYCQKPLTHSVSEARLLADAAAQRPIATQMGNQGHCHPGSRRLVELIQAGVLGRVSEVHVWTDRPIWPQGLSRPREKPPVPNGLDWDRWVGPAPERPYHPAYVPFKWRGWWDFGCGAHADGHRVSPPEDTQAPEVTLLSPTDGERRCVDLLATAIPVGRTRGSRQFLFRVNRGPAFGLFGHVGTGRCRLQYDPRVCAEYQRLFRVRVLRCARGHLSTERRYGGDGSGA